MTDAEQVEHGPTTWKCPCGRSETTDAFVLPRGWARMSLAIGDGTILFKVVEKIFCESCGSRFLLGGARAMKAVIALPPPTKQETLVPAQTVTIKKNSVTSKVRASGQSRFRK